MTIPDIIEYYVKLLILQYKGQPRAQSTIRALIKPVIMDGVKFSVQNGFAVASAVGKQLDILGKYIGISRNGFDFSGPVTLDDDEYRKVLMLKIAQNNLGSSLFDIVGFLNLWFPGQIFIFDYADMSISYYIDSSIGDIELAEFFVEQGLLPKPMAVLLSSVIFGPNVTQFFGFRTYEHPAHNANPFNDYASYQLTWPWLTYQDNIL